MSSDEKEDKEINKRKDKMSKAQKRRYFDKFKFYSFEDLFKYILLDLVQLQKSPGDGIGLI